VSAIIQRTEKENERSGDGDWKREDGFSVEEEVE
jgi:hypothetical protein